jgi:hypothetical protein
MELSAEDALRINVLLAGRIDAVRIDESSMTLYALSEKGEARVKLNPNCRDDTYLRGVREVLSSHVLGSPGGYPVYLKRWTRMGQARDGILESLLLLGEPEAVVAVVNATGITDEIARRAWWSLQTADNARCMLRQGAVAKGTMGQELADFLVEFLPFEEEAADLIASVKLVLQSDLVDDETRQQLWDRGRHKNSYYVGFLQAVPDDLPEKPAAHPLWSETTHRLEALRQSGNAYAVQLCRVLSPAGRAFLGTVGKVLDKPANQDVVVALLHAIAGYFRPVRGSADRHEYMEEISAAAEAMLANARATNDPLGEVLSAAPGQFDLIRAMLVLSMVDEPVVNPVFSRTDAIGTVMRKKLKPVFGPIQRQLDILGNQDGD